MSTPHQKLSALHTRLDACRACPNMIGPVVHGPPVLSRVFAIGQAPGPHEGKFGRPFAWTAGKTLFGWFERAFGIDEATYRERVYLAAVARCFPGKNKTGGDRKPDLAEIAACKPYLEEEIAILKPALVIPIGLVAIEQVLGKKNTQLVDLVGKQLRATWLGADVDLVCLPHPSGLSTWHRTQPGIQLLADALALLGEHPAWREAFADKFPWRPPAPIAPKPAAPRKKR